MMQSKGKQLHNKSIEVQYLQSMLHITSQQFEIYFEGSSEQYFSVRLFHNKDSPNEYSKSLPSSYHYNDVMMGAMASQITSLPFVYSTVYHGTDHRKCKKNSRHLPLCWQFTGDRWIPRTDDQYLWKYFHLMTSSWNSNPPKLRSCISFHFSCTTNLTFWKKYGCNITALCS